MMDNLYNKLCNNGKSHSMLYHYTSLDGIEAIAKNKSLRLSRLDIVNDPCEHNRIHGIWEYKIYVVCFTHVLDNENYFYEGYGPIRLTISTGECKPSIFTDPECTNEIPLIPRTDVNHKRYDDITDWGIYDVSFADILYVDNISEYVTSDEAPLCPGLIKVCCGEDNRGNMQTWEKECETCFRVTLRPKGLEFKFDRRSNKFVYHQPPTGIKYLYIPIPGDIISAEINAKESDEMKAKFNTICSKYGIQNGGQYAKPIPNKLHRGNIPR